MRFDIDFFIKCTIKIMEKIPITLFIGISSFILSLILSCFMLFLINSKLKVLKILGRLYISFFRSTPYITQLFILYYGLPQIIISLRVLSPLLVFIFSSAMNISAFNTEIIRGGLLSVDKGQKEAAISIGMTKFQMYWEIIIPQAFISIFPSLGNTLVGSIKNAAVAFTIGAVDILSQAKISAAKGYNYMEAYIAAGLVYWLLIVFIDKIQKLQEKRVYKHL